MKDCWHLPCLITRVGQGVNSCAQCYIQQNPKTNSEKSSCQLHIIDNAHEPWTIFSFNGGHGSCDDNPTYRDVSIIHWQYYGSETSTKPISNDAVDGSEAIMILLTLIRFFKPHIYILYYNNNNHV